MLDVPCAMFPNGPVCTSAGVPSVVCTRFGLMASSSSAIMAPVAPRSPAVTGRPEREGPTTMASSRLRRSARLDASAMMAIISEAAVITKPVSRLAPSPLPPTLTVTCRSARSFMSSARGHVICSGSEIERVPEEQVRVDHRGQQIVRCRNGVKVAVKMQIDLLARFYLRQASACRSTLHPKHRPKRRLARGEDGFAPDRARALARGRSKPRSCLRRKWSAS